MKFLCARNFGIIFRLSSFLLTLISMCIQMSEIDDVNNALNDHLLPFLL